MKRRSIINALMGALAVACLPVAYSRRVVEEGPKSTTPLTVSKDGNLVAVYYSDPERMYVVPGDYPGAVGSLVYHEDVTRERWYARAATERIGDMVRFVVLGHSWA